MVKLGGGSEPPGMMGWGAHEANKVASTAVTRNNCRNGATGNLDIGWIPNIVIATTLALRGAAAGCTISVPQGPGHLAGTKNLHCRAQFDWSGPNCFVRANP